MDNSIVGKVQIIFSNGKFSFFTLNEFQSYIKDSLYNIYKGIQPFLDSLNFNIEIIESKNLVISGYFYIDEEELPRKTFRYFHFEGIELENLLLKTLFSNPVSRIVISSHQISCQIPA